MDAIDRDMHSNQLADAQTASEYPLYNIGVVARMTGISIPTLRAWERRYGFPHAGRTGGGHRLYSERDVLRLRWVKAQTERGMQTAQAIQALHYQEATGRIDIDKAPQVTEPVPDQARREGFLNSLVAALTHHDLDRADQILAEALPLLHPEGLILDVIRPAMVAIGEAWANNELNVATEHLATHYLRQRLLMWMISGPPAYAMRPIVLACAPEELHEGSLLMFGVLLRRRRWPVAYLGQSVPLPDLAELVHDIAPPLVVLVAASEETASALADWPIYMPEAARGGRPIVAFAGRVFTEQPQWRLRIPGTFLGATLQEGLDTVQRLIGEHRL